MLQPAVPSPTVEERSQGERGELARRHNHALVSLARQVWRDDCTLETALGLICRTAADTLDVERVNVWRRLPDGDRLACVHAYLRSSDCHNPPGFDEILPFDTAYGMRMDEVRVIDAPDVGRDAPVAASLDAMGDYLARHDIRSLLDAPIRSDGEVIGVVCHEQVGTRRAWTPEDEAFAGSIGDYIATAYEIARRRAAEDRLRYLQLHDPVTDLPNRDHLVEATRSALHPLHPEDAGIAVVHLQLDADAEVRADDAVLQAIAADLRALLGDTVTLARVRSDAFALLPHQRTTETEALALAERCVERVANARDAVTACAGIAFSRDLAAPSADALLRNAEQAGLRARERGSLQCEVFDGERHRGLVSRLRLELALREAFQQQRFELHYQPEVDLGDGRWHAAEALLRWRDEDGSLRSADEFIDVAEGCGLIVPLGNWVLRQACGTAASWPTGADGLAPMLRVNVSARQFEQPGLVAEVSAALAASGLPPRRLCLEITETSLLRQPGTAADVLMRLRALGVSVALDDFGTGWSSLANLRTLPIDALKLDRSFVSGLPDQRQDMAIVEGVVCIARMLEVEVVAEGVEHERQVEALRRVGVRRAQGWLFSPALAEAAFLAGLASQRRR